MSKRERVARAIYHAAFLPVSEEQARRKVPSPGWCWERATDDQKTFCMRQADAAIEEIERPGSRE